MAQFFTQDLLDILLSFVHVAYNLVTAIWVSAIKCVLVPTLQLWLLQVARIIVNIVQKIGIFQFRSIFGLNASNET